MIYNKIKFYIYIYLYIETFVKNLSAYRILAFAIHLILLTHLISKSGNRD